MAKEKSPYGDFSEQDVLDAERGRFVICLENDFFLYSDSYTYSKERADELFDLLVEGFWDIWKQGDPKERAQITETLKNFKVIPLRIH